MNCCQIHRSRDEAPVIGISAEAGLPANCSQNRGFTRICGAQLAVLLAPCDDGQAVLFVRFLTGVRGIWRHR
jgi:hypothetical protein